MADTRHQVVGSDPFASSTYRGKRPLSALSDYLGAFGYSVVRADAQMAIADYGSAAMVCADADRLDKFRAGDSPAEIPSWWR